jgi:hypothetical protein
VRARQLSAWDTTQSWNQLTLLGLPSALQPQLNYERQMRLRMATAASPTFLSWAVLMDETRFTRNGILNTRNQHIWADENPHSFQGTRFQQQFAINVWAGITASLFLSPYELPPLLSGGLLFTSGQLSRYSDWLRAGQQRGQRSIPGRGKRLSLLHNLHTGSVAHPASYTMGTGGSWPLTSN